MFKWERMIIWVLFAFAVIAAFIELNKERSLRLSPFTAAGCALAGGVVDKSGDERNDR